MKRHLLFSIILVIVTMLIGGTACPAFAASGIAKAKKEYQDAVSVEQSAKAAYDSANEEFKKGTAGFFQWVADNYDGWKKEDAEEALQVLSKTSFRKYTRIGNAEDATSLDNMKSAIELLPVLQNKRANDENFRDLLAPTIRSVYMARAQVNANISSYTGEHTDNDTGCDLGEGAECLAWWHTDPFESWYDLELVNYNKIRKYTLNKYNLDTKSIEWQRFILQEDFDYDAYLKETQKFGETGHYAIVCLGDSMVYNFDLDPSDPDYITFEKSEHVFFGLGYSEYGPCHCLQAATDSYPEGYTVSEYTELFNTYYNMVFPEAELTAYKAAKDNKKKALSALKKAAQPNKPNTKRMQKKVYVNWKKLEGINGYQISVSPRKSKTKIVATTGKNTSKKQVKINNAKKQYVKIRSFIEMDNEMIYSNWSQVRLTK